MKAQEYPCPELEGHRPCKRKHCRQPSHSGVGREKQERAGRIPELLVATVEEIGRLTVLEHVFGAKEHMVEVLGIGERASRS